MSLHYTDNTARKEAEAYVLSLETQPGFAQLLLTSIQQHCGADANADDRAIRLSGAVLFKNLVKRRWALGE
jgi:hypothetical protein